MTVAITGGTGFVGSRLVQKLLEEGHKVRVLTRSATNARSVFSGKANGQPEIVEPAGWAAALHGCTGVVNLAGTPISTRWTPEIKAEIKQSRVDVTSKLAAAINATPEEQRPKVLVSSSALGFYGTSDNLSFDESSPSGSDYLAEVSGIPVGVGGLFRGRDMAMQKKTDPQSRKDLELGRPLPGAVHTPTR